MCFYTRDNIKTKIINSVTDYEMLFIGEIPHYNKKINNFVAELAVDLAKQTKFRIYAKESLYCWHPVLELASKAGIENKLIPKNITEYNRNVDPEYRIWVSSVDLAHSIKYDPKIVNVFINGQIADIQNDALKNEIITLSAQLIDNEDINSKNSIIAEMKELLESYKTDIDAKTFEELMFYFELLIVSLSLNDLSIKKQADLRNEWFKKTIDRALDRSTAHGKMILHVGSPHAYKCYADKENYYVGKIPEAAYYKEKACSLLIRPFYLGNMGEPTEVIEDPIELKALEHLGNEEAVYVDLHEYHDSGENCGINKYISEGQYQYDGIVYISQ